MRRRGRRGGPRARRGACSRRPARSLWVDAEAMLDAVTARLRQRPGLRVLFPRGAGGGGARRRASRRADARRLAYATFAGAVALAHGSRAEPGDAARAGDVEGRHHRARRWRRWRPPASRPPSSPRSTARPRARARARRRPRQRRLTTRPDACSTKPSIPARHRVRPPHLRVPAALRDAVAARAVPQSARSGRRRADRLGGEAGAARDPRRRRRSTRRRCCWRGSRSSLWLLALHALSARGVCGRDGVAGAARCSPSSSCSRRRCGC